MMGYFEYFQFYIAFPTPRSVSGINGSLLAYGIGTVVLLDENDNIHELQKVMYVPGLNDLIISKHWTKRQGLTTSLDKDEEITLSAKSGFSITTTSTQRISTFPTARWLKHDPNYYSKVTPIVDDLPIAYERNTRIMHISMASLPSISESQLWHERLGHISAERLRRIGIEHAPEKCDFYLLGKQTRQPFIANKDRSTWPLELVYSDICGPITPTSIGNARYFITFTDDFTRYCWTYSIPDKSSKTIFQIFKTWQSLVENQAGLTIRRLRTDQGKEYLGNHITHLQTQGITHESNSGYSPQSNGVSERLNHTLMDMVRPMLVKSQMPSAFWAEALSTATYIRNRLPTKSLPYSMSPHEA
jgi:hypothetical protein